MRDAKVSEHSPILGMRGILAALGFTVFFFFIELVGGILTNSLALTTDAWHMLNDAFSLVFTLVASWVAQWPITKKRTYGYYRAEIVSSLLQGILLWAIVVFIFYEAFQRLLHPVYVRSLDMLIIAALGLLANGLSAVALSRSGSKSLNVKGAFLHVVSDLLGSIGVIAAGLIMLLTGWYLADPLLSIMIGVLIFYSAFGLVRESLNVLLEGVPPNIDVTSVENRIRQVEGVESVHDLHVWCITPSMTCALSVHIVVRGGVDRKKLTATLMNTLKEEFGVDHTTIQLEDKDYPKAFGEH